MLAHDIRGALSSVIGGIALVDREGMDEETRLQFDRVAAAAESLSSLVTGAIAGARGDAPETSASLDLDGFLRFLARRWSGEAHAVGLAFELALAPGLPERLRVEHLDLARILGNLIGNAIKFSDRGTVRLAVHREPAGDLAFVLQDDGPGLRDGDARHVFDFGYRSGGGKPGQGIGLHIAKTLTDRLGGRITLANRPEGGVEATCVLPGALCEGRRGEEEARGGEPPDLGGLRVLLAEDNPTNQMVASQMLRALNADVVLASDGVEALAQFEAEDIDLLIVDIEMPRKSGLDVIREVRARSDRRARTPIVALTAYAMQEHRDRISDAGADGLISKPIISIEAFGRAVAAIAGPRRGAAPPAQPAADAAPGPLVDMGTYEALAQTIGPEMMAELLDRVVVDLEDAAADLRRAADPVDAAAVRASSHILISVAGAVGAVRLQACARSLNTEAHGPATPELAAGIAACLGEIDGALGFVREQRARC